MPFDLCTAVDLMAHGLIVDEIETVEAFAAEDSEEEAE